MTEDQNTLKSTVSLHFVSARLQVHDYLTAFLLSSSEQVYWFCTFLCISLLVMYSFGSSLVIPKIHYRKTLKYKNNICDCSTTSFV